MRLIALQEVSEGQITGTKVLKMKAVMLKVKKRLDEEINMVQTHLRNRLCRQNNRIA